jgi:transposase-like protein
MEEIKATSYLAVGRKYGVSDNAVRNWVRFYERQAERGAEAQAGSDEVDPVRDAA